MKRASAFLGALALLHTSAFAQLGPRPGGGTGSGSVQSVATSCGVAGGPITTTGTIQGSLTPATKTANYTTALTDCGSALFFNIASAATLTLANLTTTSNFVNVRNLATSGGVLTIAPSSGTIDGLASLTLQPGAPGLTIAFDGTNYTTSGVASAGKVLTNAQTGTSYTVAATDYAKLVTFTNASAIAVSLPSASFTTGDFLSVRNIAGAAGVVTITPTSGTIDGGATLVLAPGTPAVSLAFDGTNWTTTGKATTGPSSSTANNCVKWAGVNGQLLADSGSACGGGAPAGSAGEVQLNNGSGGFSSAGEDPYFHPGYATGLYYTPITHSPVPAAGSALGLTKMACFYGQILRPIHITSLSVYVTTAAAADFVSLAIYANDPTTGRPAAKIVNSNGFSVASAPATGTVSSTALGPGTTSGRDLWWCYQSGSTTAVLSSITPGGSDGAGLYGAVALSDAIINANIFSSLFCSTCGGQAISNTAASSTFTWPASLAGTTWSDGTSTRFAPAIAFTPSSVP